MFLDRICQLGLLQHDPESNIVAPLPLAVRRKLIWEVVQCLSSRTSILAVPPAQVLSSTRHVEWMMELLGAGFALPIEDVAIVGECVAVYRVWLLDNPELIPSALRAAIGQAYEQRFLQTCFMHMSLLFQPRKPHDAATLQNEPLNPDTQCATHVNLCRQILAVFLTCAQQQTQKQMSAHSQSEYSFSNETWSVLIKVVLGCADRLLVEPTLQCVSNSGGLGADDKGNRRTSYLEGTSSVEKGLVALWGGRGAESKDRTPMGSVSGEFNLGPKMGDALCDSLSKVLFEVWLRSGEMSVDLWSCLKEEFFKWTHRIEVIRNWNAVVLGLTNRVINQLYGGSEGTLQTCVTFVTGGSFSLDLKEDFAVYAWHRLTYIIGNVNSIESPEIFHVAIKGIAKVVDAFHAVGIDSGAESDSNSPEGNTLLHMFGAWLFEAVTRKSPEYEDGISEAYAILCRIFCQRQRRKQFLQTYLARFYSALSVGLRTGHPQTLTSIILNCEHFFGMDLQGSRVLVYDFAIGVRRVLPAIEDKDWGSTYGLDELRRGTLKVLGCIMGFSNRFSTVPMRGLIPQEKNEWSARIQEIYQDSEPRPSSSVTGADQGTAAPKSKFSSLKLFCLDVLLSSLSVEQNPQNCKFILHLLGCFAYEEVLHCPGAICLILDAVKAKMLSKTWPHEVMPSVFDLLSQTSAFWAPVNNCVKSTSKDVVSTLCSYVDGLFCEDDVITNQQMIIKGYDCMIRWALVGGWIEKEKDCLLKVYASLCRGVSILSRDDEFSAVSGSNPGSSKHQSGSNGNISAGQLPTTPTSQSTNSTTSALANHFATFAGNVSSAMGSDKIRKGRRSLKSRGTTITSPLATLVAAVTTANGKDAVPTSPLKSNVGVSTFAKLTAESSVKAAAEICLSQMLNHLGNFPPRGSTSGVSRVSTLFCEISEVKRLLAQRRYLLDSVCSTSELDMHADGHSSLEDLGPSISEYKRFLRYYVYDNRIILGLLEQPEWAMPDNASNDSDSETSDQTPRDPKLILIIRDATGKFSWQSTLKYFDANQKKDSTASTRVTCDMKKLQPLAVADLRVTESARRPRPVSAPHAGRSRMAVELPVEIPSKCVHESDGNLVESIEFEVTSASIMGDAQEKIAPYSLKPSLPPHIPANSEVLTAECYNESAIPKFADLVNADTEEGRKYELLKRTIEKCIQAEQESYDSFASNAEPVDRNTAARPTPPVDQYDPNIPSCAFRLFLTHMGFLGLESHEKLKPLVMTEAFLKDLEKMDALAERECFGINVLYSKDANASIETLLRPKTIDNEFFKFLHSIGTPVDLSKHVGYRGNLSSSTCRTTSYFASRNVEMIFNSPYTIRVPESISMDEAERLTELKNVYTNSTPDTHVLILWIESLHDLAHLIKRITSTLLPSVTAAIVVHPQASASGLYDIRILNAAGLVEENWAIGPLVNGMIISQSALAKLVRSSAQSAHLVTRILKSNYRRPHTARRLMIEEICNKHKLATSWAGFYADLFSFDSPKD
ncbi:hypothetical protein HDU78_000611 [Chytriomyces hyalinus]|nr:hypothetical protein HDU78_000611 [Chytriomyces hyalinus]